MAWYYFRFFLVLITLITPSFASTHEESVPVKVELVAEGSTIQSNQPFWVALHLKLEKGWHVYWKNPGDAGLPLQLKWTLPEGFQSEPLQWPFPEKFTIEELVGFGYHDEVILLSRIIPPSNLVKGQDVQLAGEVKWLVCSSSTCQPGSIPVKLDLKVDSEPAQKNELASEVFNKARLKMPKSHIQVKTVHKEGIVQLQVPSIDLTNVSVTGVSFFPEEQNIIDSSVEPVLALDEVAKDNNGYLVNLKMGEEIGAKTQKLKGVLVVHTKDQKEGMAFDIDSPIENDGQQEFLSLADGYRVLEKYESGIGNSSVSSTAQSAFEGGLGWALISAFIGGLILNLMPCVLPVMSFKILSFVKMAGQSRSLTLKHGISFSAGVIISFWILAGVMLLLRTYGEAVGWGFQLQEPLFVVILATILFICALSLFGVFEWGLSVSSWAGQTQAEAAHQSSYISSFLSGVMATAVATPCTGPFLGSAVGFAVTLPVFQSLLIFTFLGLGMCSPYLLLAAFPSFLRFVPKPGAWMEIFKHLMGFLLLATVLWLLWVFSAQTNSLSLICLLAGFLCFSMGAWMYGQGCSPVVSRSKRIVSYIFITLAVAAGIQLILIPRNSWYESELVANNEHKGAWSGWETFSPERVAELQRNGTPVLIDFTAKWCLICQTNHMVLASDEVNRNLEELGVVKMKADWTRNDPVITKALSQFGRTSVPLYVLYGKDGVKEPVLLPQILTQDIVLDHIKQAIPAEEIAIR